MEGPLLDGREVPGDLDTWIDGLRERVLALARDQGALGRVECERRGSLEEVPLRRWLRLRLFRNYGLGVGLFREMEDRRRVQGAASIGPVDGNGFGLCREAQIH